MDEGIEEGTDVFQNVAQGLYGPHKQQLINYWQQAIDQIEHIGEGGANQAQDAFKSTALPLARIKKVMKTDSEVRMISAEAPILFAKGCDIFITELTMRAWIHAEENKRRTLQRSDIATALQKSDVFDFLIDIVPREEAQPRRYTGNYEQPEAVSEGAGSVSEGANVPGVPNVPNVPGVPGNVVGIPGESPGEIESVEAEGPSDTGIVDTNHRSSAPDITRVHVGQGREVLQQAPRVDVDGAPGDDEGISNVKVEDKTGFDDEFPAYPAYSDTVDVGFRPF